MEETVLNKLTIITLMFLLCRGAALGQDLEFQFLDHESHEPIVGMVVLLRSTATEQLSQGVTDLEGIYRTQMPWPVEIETKHLSYEPHHQTIASGHRHVFHVRANATVMEDVTVTSDPYQNYSTNKDLFVVEEMSRQMIDQLGGNDLGDLLNFNANISVTPDAGTGRSTVSMFGLSGEYVKILLDNVPIVSDNGVGNDIDITQINLDNVERIEVVEGSMGVMYGSNAVAGIINIITKKDLNERLIVKASVQEETVGGEYNWSDEGRHIQRVSIAGRVNDKLSLLAYANHNDFKGFKNDQRGKNYYGDEGVRGYEWNPKEQFNLNGTLRFAISPATALSYKFAFYDEELVIYDTTLIGGVGVDGLPEYKAKDQSFMTKRQVHGLTFDQRFGEVPLTVFVSYQNQTRYNEQYTYDLENQIKVSTTGLTKNQSSELIYSKGVVSNLFPTRGWLSLTTGYELDYQSGYDAIASGAYSSKVSEQSLRNTDFFLQSDFNMGTNWKVSPGVRINNNSVYDNHLIWSLSSVLKLPANVETQLVIGSAYKTPNYTQLFMYFVDANHDVTGNADLDPEDGISILLNLSKKGKMGLVTFKSELKGYHFNIKDKIDLALVTDSDPNTSADIQRSTYLNINQYQTLGISTNNHIQIKNLSVQLGAAYTGVRQSIQSEETDEDYLFTLTGTGQVAYQLPKQGISMALNFKYNGPNERYDQNDDGINKVILDSFSFLDASVQKHFFDCSLEVKLGARNLLDVVSVNASGSSSGGFHDSSAPTSQLFAYGRSYFINLAYTFKK
ncbi:TonB-dependent receptor plug domain-containing protein [Reichenbachiella agarivorans]|uniref:TonB-dependent receptor plug domain-containing protein n=1 Tax=Reichenbachiella agarivorans TaxID=2979464 RepID=A0ABY6CZK5_9BACT|nr:TonB-dependent receptor plug domain-containing protein [Reichenbachiella agarivorans]UXP33675.1 TonB-dependent receptor plug domain-containing protein [Reichenbachiella agarivorans]